MTSLSNNTSSTVTSAATSTAKISTVQPTVPPVKIISNPISDAVGNIHHPDLHQTNSTSNQLLTTSIIRKPITSSTFDNINKTNNINYIATASTNPSSSTAATVTGISTAIPFSNDPSSDLIKISANLNNNINVLNNASSQLPNNLDPIESCTSYYSNNRTEVPKIHFVYGFIFFLLMHYFPYNFCPYSFYAHFSDRIIKNKGRSREMREAWENCFLTCQGAFFTLFFLNSFL